MNRASKVVGVVVGLAVVFAGAYALGATVGGPGATGGMNHGGMNHGDMGAGGMNHGGMNHGDMGAGGMDHHAGPGAAADPPVGGLAVESRGFRMRRVSPDPTAGQPGELAFQILGPDAKPLGTYLQVHDKLLHLIVVRRDLSGFQHLHPELGTDDIWRIPLTLPAAGDYRAVADFVPDNTVGNVVLGTDLTVGGDYRPTPLTAPATEASVDGYGVRMTQEPGMLRFTVSRDGAPVTDLQPYLAAYGHLVALRQGDLGYLHVHPDGGPGQGPAGPEIAFHTDLPPGGTYRLYLEFLHHDTVHRAEFTVGPGPGR